MITLRELIQTRGTTQQDLLPKLGWVGSRLNRYVSGSRAMGPAEATAIGKALKARPIIQDGKILFELKPERRKAAREIPKH